MDVIKLRKLLTSLRDNMVTAIQSKVKQYGEIKDDLNQKQFDFCKDDEEPEDLISSTGDLVKLHMIISEKMGGILFIVSSPEIFVNSRVVHEDFFPAESLLIILEKFPN